MAGRKKRLYCENEIERALEDSLSEGSDVSSESEVQYLDLKVKVYVTVEV
jgi:hypothetical protein